MGSRSQLGKIARSCGFGHSWKMGRGLCFSYGDGLFPFWVVAKVDSHDEVRLYGRVRTYGVAGCRTDLHDWIGVLWCSCLRVLDVASSWIMDESGFVSEEEIYGRYLLFNQPTLGRFSIQRDFEEIARLFSASAVAAQMVAQIWCEAGITEDDVFEYKSASLHEWIASFSSSKSRRRKSIFGRRSNRVNYYLDCSASMSLTDFRECSAWREIWSDFFDAPFKGTMGETDEAHLLRSGRIRNVIWKRAEKSVIKLAERAFKAKPNVIHLVPCESHLFAITPSGLCSKRIDSGGEAYAEQFERLRRQHAKNASFLNHDIRFRWAVQVDPGRLEALVGDLLACHPEVMRVKQVGHCNEPDGGRDFIVDVHRSFLKYRSVSKDEQPTESVQIIVQCKASDRNIGKAAVPDIRDTVDQHRAFGFLLVALPGLTRPLLDYIEGIRSRGLFWVDCWSRTDLEAQLRTNPDAATHFADMVAVINPRKTP